MINEIWALVKDYCYSSDQPFNPLIYFIRELAFALELKETKDLVLVPAILLETLWRYFVFLSPHLPQQQKQTYQQYQEP